MRIGRFKKGRLTAYGVVEGDELLEIRGSIYTKFRITDNRFNLADVKLLSPTNPQQIWCPGPNFANDDGYENPQFQPSDCPQPWQKGRNSLIGPNDFIVLPKDSTGEVHAEGEAVAVISKLCRRISKEKALRYVLGFTCGNDVSERQWQWDDRHLWRAKGSDTFAPVGPWIETEASPLNLDVSVKINGENVQSSCTSEMVHDFASIISYISQQVTLQPGDLVFSGSRGDNAPIKPADVVEVSIGGIGTLKNTVRMED
jgi:2-keto-4-pentenoate hydratase/2-oxohepta-3-ene-1,7-dioic acid hydratase in catechol pathway